jgi:osmotically inducible lipoprotein OsmB
MLARSLFFVAMAAALCQSACTTTQQRVSGAGAGALVGSVAGPPGAGVGAVGGAVFAPSVARAAR